MPVSCSLCAAGPSCPACGTALTAVQLPGHWESEVCETCGYSRQASFARDLERHSLMCDNAGAKNDAPRTAIRGRQMSPQATKPRKGTRE